ncbi:START domain-containing protein [Ketobacter sp.]|uniref:START domain-containing protein n=1 Tax=Ketobacter sp. TaxID=2083498 RepID=UPI000F1EE9C3|nr:START domain-containing protein [Ketobacter sp.]RLT96764.1 MAG: hypothetical protein D9N14_12040 [Ketobacter sp.]
MKKPLIALTLLLSCLSHAFALEIDNLDWELKKEKGGIKVLSAVVPDSRFSAYLAITVVEASTDDLVQIIRNPATCTDWVYRCGESYRFAQETPNVDLVYTASKMPFPLKDRDTLARITWEKDPRTQAVRAVGVATRDILAPLDQHIRIEQATVIWELTPLEDGSTLVRTFGHADPGGELPSWLTNQLSTEVPVKTLNGLKALAAERQAQRRETFRYSVTQF